MKVQVIDPTAFNAIDPQIARRYLIHNGWTHQHTLPSDVSIWVNESVGENGARIWFPDRASLPDYSQVTERAIRTIANAENRSETKLIEDLQTIALGDVVRVSSEDAINTAANTLKFNDCIRLFQKAYNMKVSSANSEHSARPVHHSSRARLVQNFAQRMLAGQTEPGSYIVKLISPITEDDLIDLQSDPDQQQFDNMSALPFSRRSINRMTQSLDRLNDISREAALKGKYYFDPFRDAVGLGVSANLCEAVAKHNGDTDTPLGVTVTWSYAVPNTGYQQGVYQVEFEPQQMRYLRTAASEFRQKNPRDVQLTGYVKMLSRDKGETSGDISLVTIVDKSQRVVKMELDGEKYQHAITAHEQELEFVVVGTLQDQGRLLWLVDIGDVFVSKQMNLIDELDETND